MLDTTKTELGSNVTCDGDGDILTFTANWFHGLGLEDLEKPHGLPVGPFLVPTGTFCWVQTQGAPAAGRQMLLVDIHSESFGSHTPSQEAAPACLLTVFICWALGGTNITVTAA